MKCEAHGGLRGRNSVLGRGASCFREGGGAGYPVEAHPERACVPEYGGEGIAFTFAFAFSHSQSTVLQNIIIYEKRSHARKTNAFWQSTPRFCVGAVCARLVPRRVRVKADACAAFRMGSLMIPTSLGHSWK